MSRREVLMRWMRGGALVGAVLGGLGAIVLVRQTVSQLQPLPTTLPPAGWEIREPRFTDRSGVPLTVTYQNPWNVHDRVAYHDVPAFLRQAFVWAEDKRFFRHRGVDWLARAHALVQNLLAGRAVRGASTISEQVIRMLHPRPRTVWSRWLEGFEAARLEERFSKAEILEFYLNQVPYAHQRRGVVQAARTYFDRDLDTLSSQEMLALAVLVRSPSRLDLLRGTEEIRLPLDRLARRLQRSGQLPAAELEVIARHPLVVMRPSLPVEAAHFVSFVRQQQDAAAEELAPIARTTLDASLQLRVQQILDRQVDSLAGRQVADGAVLVVDHTTDEILAWVNAGGFSNREGGQIDKVTAPRQPGSTLKPFVYALALEKGWTPATLIEDGPLADAVGHGLHDYRNYSRLYHGPLRLREALGNSLNTPAVRAVRFTGRGELLERLRAAGLTTLGEHPDFYGDGLALGTGEVSLYALVGAYAALARGGELRPLRWCLGAATAAAPRRIFDPEVSSLIADILSDPDARSREFGRGSVLTLPVQTAVKTGTSNDYRDAWTLGFSHRYTVGVWMGNADRRPMREVSGSLGPALVLRAVFAELHRHLENESLFLSRRLGSRRICAVSGSLPGARCPVVSEWFRPGRGPMDVCLVHRLAEEPAASRDGGTPRLVSPTPGLHLAKDPRIPDELEVFELRLTGPRPARVEWMVDGRVVAATNGPAYHWPVTRGHHLVRARVWLGDSTLHETQTVGFLVK